MPCKVVRRMERHSRYVCANGTSELLVRTDFPANGLIACSSPLFMPGKHRNERGNLAYADKAQGSETRKNAFPSVMLGRRDMGFVADRNILRYCSVSSRET